MRIKKRKAGEPGLAGTVRHTVIGHGSTVRRDAATVHLGDRARIMAGRMFLHVGVVTATYPWSALVELECGEIVAVPYRDIERLPARMA